MVGPPRSGTTWIAQAIRHGAGCRYVHEPDNERYSPLALRLKAGLGRFPVTLYKEQWAKLLGMADEIRAFIKENDAKLKAKE